MLPILLSIGPIKIYTFGIFLALAFFWASFLLWKLVRLTAYKEEDVFDTMFLSLIIGLISGRLFYVLFHFKEFGLDILKIILVNGFPGISLYGLIIGFVTTFIIILSIKKIKVDEIIDYTITPAFIALAIGKIGAFFSGVETGGPRHLTPFYEGLVFFVAAFLAYKLLFEIRKEKYSHGFLFPLFGFIYSLSYIIFDPIRGKKEIFINQNINLEISLIILLTTGVYFIYYFRSPIGDGLKGIINFFTNHGQKIVKNFAKFHPTKTGNGEKKTSKPN